MDRGHYVANGRMATALLQVLGSAGEGARARVLRAVDRDPAALRAVDGWVDPEQLARMFEAAGADRGLARQVGHELVAPSRVGLFLTYSGVATLEKAYRQIDRLLAREQRGTRYHAREIDEGRACIEFSREETSPEIFCGVREGMLQALPLAYGLLPGRVRETICVHRGGKACVYEVQWTRSPQTGLAAGLLAGALSGSGLSFALTHVSVLLPVVSFAPALLALALVTVCTVVGAAMGRSVDLARQLHAVAGARRGQLALLDQADRALAEKMDDLAKLDASLEALGTNATAAVVTAAATAVTGESPPPSAELAEAVDRIRENAEVVHRGLGQLSQRFVARRKWTRAQLGRELREWVSASRRLETAVGELKSQLAPGEQGVRPRDLGALARRAGEALRGELGAGQTLDLDVAADLPQVECEAFQIEQVMEQLLRNARDATEGGGRIRMVMRAAAGGVELVVSDDGRGMDNDELEQVFDPFFAPPVAGVDTRGIGLPVCYRIVGGLGGELQIASTLGEGTEVTILLPAAHAAGN